ncbi:hypothetical protein EV561_11771 [Rhizobium sp. BK376]|nr:hypothetical protein EV561_11771 [Rhizobium sp. BK376]
MESGINIYSIIEFAIVVIIILSAIPFSKYRDSKEIPKKKAAITIICLLPLLILFAYLAPYAVK